MGTVRGRHGRRWGARLPLQAAPAPQPCGGPGGEKSQAAECDKAPKTLRRNWGEGLGEITTFENSTRAGAGAAGAAAHGGPDRTHAPGRSGILGLRFRLLCRPSGPLVSKALPRPSADWGRGLFFCFFFFFNAQLLTNITSHTKKEENMAYSKNKINLQSLKKHMHWTY